MKIQKGKKVELGILKAESYSTDTGCFIMVAKEDGLWHLSISHNRRYPTWDEIKTARYELLPHDRYIAMILPPPTEYVNIHDNCFHLHELADSEIRIARR